MTSRRLNSQGLPSLAKVLFKTISSFSRALYSIIARKISASIREEMTAHQHQIIGGQLLDVNFAEAIDEGPGETLSATTLLQRILGSEDAEGRMSRERASKFWDEYSATMIQNCVQAFKHGLRCKIHFIQ